MGAARTSRMIGSEQVQTWQVGRYRTSRMFVYTVQLLCRFVWFSGAVSHHRETVFFDFEFSRVSFFFFFAFFFLAVMWQCPLDANFGRLRLVSSKHVFCSWLGREEERSFLTFNESCCFLIVVGFEFSILPPWIGSKESGVACFMKNEWRVYLGISV